MKILILSVTAGDGHNAMGRAVIEEAKKRGHETLMVDLFKGIDNLRQFLAEDWYFWTLKHFPKFSQRTYNKLKKADYHKKPSLAYRFMMSSKKAQKNIRNTISEYKPDMIYCTHVYTASLMSKWRKSGIVNVPCFFIVSDYVIHINTEQASNIDYLLTPTTDFDDKLIDMGYKKESLLNIGITVNPKFALNQNKITIREKLSLNPSLTTILSIGGATGFGNSVQLIKDLKEMNDKLQLIIVNGRNTKLKEKLDKLIKQYNLTNFHNLGYVKNVDELMDASDAMVGKIGGVGLTEAFNKNLPIIVPACPPFQEYDNLIYLTNKNCVLYTGNAEKTKLAIIDLVENPNSLKSLQENVVKIKKPNATIDLVNFMEKLYDERKDN